MSAWFISWCLITAALATALIQKLRGKRMLWMRAK
jgi:hypothetical protein